MEDALVSGTVSVARLERIGGNRSHAHPVVHLDASDREDAQQLRAGSSAQVMAAIVVLRLSGFTSAALAPL